MKSSVALDVQWIGGFVRPPWAFVGLALRLLWPVLGLPLWRSEPHWIDRLGRVVGWEWIVAEAGLAADAYVLA